MIYNPLEEFESRFQVQHRENTRRFFEELVQASGIDIEKNRETVAALERCRTEGAGLRKKRNRLRFLRVLMCITVVLIPLVIWKMTPKIRRLKEEIETADQRAAALLADAYAQMLPLNSRFTDRDALRLAEQTVPDLSFESCFSARQEEDMKINYDFSFGAGAEQSSLDVLAGHYNENPFLFESRRTHTMGVETYHGSKTIHWTERYRDSDGTVHTRTRTQTLHASVTKPKPFYSTQVVLNYCAQGGPELCFSRDASHLEQRSEKEIEKLVKRGEKRLKKKTDRALEDNTSFTQMSNTDFEVLFDALDRTDEVQFRTLFTPLAQTNMVDLILSHSGFGDDFHFFKRRRTNQIVSNHSQGRALYLLPKEYISYAYDTVRENFLLKNEAFFKAVYFDFAPLWAIPVYQERPVQSLKPIPDGARRYSLQESEALANAVTPSLLVHPQTKTPAILKAAFVAADGERETTSITAFSYDIEKRVDVVSVYGDDGHYHNVPVEWDEYIPLQANKQLWIGAEGAAGGEKPLASRNGIGLFMK